jgi:23S rRNA (guanosine2251-2'-O)-methyltransferase
VEGRQAVRELLAGTRPVQQVLVAEGMDEAPILDEIEALASARRVRITHVPRRRIDSLARSEAAQGVVAVARPVEAVSLASLCEPSPLGGAPFLLAVDGVSDPHNLGSLLRSAECAGVTGVVLPKHRSVHLSPTVTKVASGAVEHLPIALVAGMPSALERLSSLGIWSVGLVADRGESVYELSFTDAPVALVVGSEGGGLSRLSERRCDVLASIPQHGSIASLNVAVAGAVACFEIARRRIG